MIAFDDEVDAAYFGIVEGIQSLLARQTPVATDLRLVLAMLHVNLHLERMADYCVTVAKLTKLAATGSHKPRIVASMAEMGVRAEEMSGLPCARSSTGTCRAPRRSSTSTS